MMAVHKLDRTKGLDLILHTQGGSISATQSIVNYLHKMFGKNTATPDIRAVVPPDCHVCRDYDGLFLPLDIDG